MLSDTLFPEACRHHAIEALCLGLMPATNQMRRGSTRLAHRVTMLCTRLLRFPPVTDNVTEMTQNSTAKTGLNLHKDIQNIKSNPIQ